MKPRSVLLLLLTLAALLLSQPEGPPARVGPVPGGYLLNSGWIVRPAGTQVPVDTFPMASLLSRDGKHLLVLHGGYNPPSIAVIELATNKVVSSVRVPDAWLGLAMTADGRRVYVGGGSTASVYEFTFANATLTPARTFAIVPEAARKHQDFTGDVQLTPDGRLIYATMLHRDQVVVINPQSGRVIERFPVVRRPYRILFHPDGQSFFVSSWADGRVQQYETANGAPLGARLSLGPHTTDMVISDRKPDAAEADEPEEKEKGEWPYTHRLFVTAGNTNRVYVAGITASKEMKLIESINVALTPRQPAGMTPSAVALSADQKRLHVVCSDANAVAVVDVAARRSEVEGFLPVGWYPTAARVLPDNRLAVLNGRGARSYPNPRGPQANKAAAKSHLGLRADEYVGAIQKGTLSVIAPWNSGQLETYTRTVAENSPYRDALLDDARVPQGNVVPSQPGGKSPIQHVVYIVKENRTYDQVFGGMEKGNGDKSLMLFDEKSAPNHWKLARDFVLFDNFYVNADVSADGHNWSMAAIAPDYVQRMWPNSYGGRRKHYDYEGGEPAALPPAGYIWNNVLAAGLPMRNYGYFGLNKEQPGPDGIQIESIRDSRLEPVTNRKFRAFDMDYLDIDRAKVFLEDLAEFEKQGSMPRFLVLRIGNDHTSGTVPGKIAPLSAMADNDYALGMIVEALSKSRFWPATAVFVLEDDAQNGPDHVDSHRSPAFILSPYTRRGIVDSTMYNTTSMLRTMELILGLRPMTTFDAGARPMYAAFAPQPDTRPWTAEKPRIPIDAKNPANNPTAARSLRLDFSEADRIDDLELNDILWLAIRGTEPPAPVRSFFSR